MTDSNLDEVLKSIEHPSDAEKQIELDEADDEIRSDVWFFMAVVIGLISIAVAVYAWR